MLSCVNNGSTMCVKLTQVHTQQKFMFSNVYILLSFSKENPQLLGGNSGRDTEELQLPHSHILRNRLGKWKNATYKNRIQKGIILNWHKKYQQSISILYLGKPTDQSFIEGHMSEPKSLDCTANIFKLTFSFQVRLQSRQQVTIDVIQNLISGSAVSDAAKNFFHQ